MVRSRRGAVVPAFFLARCAPRGLSAYCAPMTATPDPVQAPDPAAIQRAHRQLSPFVRETPSWHWQGHRLRDRVGEATTVWLKLECLQHTGSFKPRGALCAMQALAKDQLARGVTAVSAGNHAIAVAYASRVLGSHAKVAMPRHQSVPVEMKIRPSARKASGL